MYKKIYKKASPEIPRNSKGMLLKGGKNETNKGKPNLQPSRNLAEKLQVGTLWRHPVTACDSLADINIGLIV